MQVNRQNPIAIIQKRIDELNGMPSTLRTEALLMDMLNVRAHATGSMSDTCVAETIETKLASMKLEKKRHKGSAAYGQGKQELKMFGDRQRNLEEILTKIRMSE